MHENRSPRTKRQSICGTVHTRTRNTSTYLATREHREEGVLCVFGEKRSPYTGQRWEQPYKYYVVYDTRREKTVLLLYCRHGVLQIKSSRQRQNYPDLVMACDTG